jgi:carboxypeptidase family protein
MFKRTTLVPSLRLLILLGSLCACPLLQGQQNQTNDTVSHSLHVTVHDNAQKPVAHAHITVKADGATVWSGKTNEKGEANISQLPARRLSLTVSKDGFQALTDQAIAMDQQSAELDVLLAAKVEIRETVNVQAGDAQDSSSSIELGRSEMKQLPNRPNVITDALPLSPAVVRAPDGQITIAGGDEKHSVMLVNSVNVTDPATGQFGLSIPVNSAETVNVSANPFVAQYGGFTAGVVSATTRRGGDKWTFELNDPMPEFRIRSLHIDGVRSVSPDVTFSGPLLKQKLYFAESIQYELQNTPVRTLPYPVNETRTDARNSFTQLDFLPSTTHTLTGTVHLQTADTKFAGLDFFNPQPTTPNFDWKAGAVTLIDRLDLGSGVLQSTLTGQDFNTSVAPQGALGMIITPVGNQGNYFSSQTRRSTRLSLMETFALHPLKAKGAHNLIFGINAERSDNRGLFSATPVLIQDMAGNVLKEIDFVGGSHFHRTDLEFDGFAQDHWVLAQSFAIDAGLRVEQQRITATQRYAPRVGFSWSPFGKGSKTVVRGGTGVFYDHVPLNVFAFQQYPQQVVTTLAPVANVGPMPGAASIDPHFPLILGHGIGRPHYAPYSMASSLEVEHVVNRLVKLQAKFSYRDSGGLIMVLPAVDASGQDSYIVRNTGSAEYRDLELSARIGEQSKRKLFFSYVRSISRGDLNTTTTYLGNLPSPIVRPDFFTNLPGDVPNRFLLWGETPLPWKTKIMPLLEFRSGFPYSNTDAGQNYVGAANGNRFPNYFSLDTRVSKDFQLTPKYATRISVRALNMTNHFNALAIHSNTGDPQFGNFFGNYPRRFRLDFDVLF